MEVLVFGGGGHALVLIDLIKRRGEHNVIGYLDLVNRGSILGVPYLGSDNIAAALRRDRPNLRGAIGVGQMNISPTREKIFLHMKSLGFEFPAFVSMDAYVGSGVELGEGAMIFPGAIINPECKIGIGVIVNTGARIDHRCSIGAFTAVAPGVTICGDVEIGSNCIVGAGSTIIQSKKIADQIFVGAGSLVVKSLTDPGVYYGTPVEFVR